MSDNKDHDLECVHCIIGLHLQTRQPIDIPLEVNRICQAIGDIIASNPAQRATVTRLAFTALGRHATPGAYDSVQMMIAGVLRGATEQATAAAEYVGEDENTFRSTLVSESIRLAAHTAGGVRRETFLKTAADIWDAVALYKTTMGDSPSPGRH